MPVNALRREEKPQIFRKFAAMPVPLCINLSAIVWVSPTVVKKIAFTA